MSKMRLFMASVVISISLSAFAGSLPATGLKPQIEAAIKAENARWADAYARGDYQAIARLYTQDGTLLPPGGDRVTGPSAIVNFFTRGTAGGEPDTVTFSNYEFYGDDNIVTEVSDSDIRNHNGTLKSRGKQILIFLKQNGIWKLHRDIWNVSGTEKK